MCAANEHSHYAQCAAYKGLKLAGAYRSKGRGVLWPCRGTDSSNSLCAGARVARSLSAIR